MIFLLLGIILLIVILIGGRAFLNANPADLARGIKLGGGIAALLVAALLFIGRQWAFAVPVAVFGLSLLGVGRGAGFGGLGTGGRPRPGQTSSVKTAALDVALDHDTGAISGVVLAGPHEGRDLDDLSAADLAELWTAFAQSDEESRLLLEAYLDRRMPGWREDFETGDHAGTGDAAARGPMTPEEAYEVLGLEPGASEAEVRAAHRRLMKMAHPDMGGSAFLAAKINEAKELLLNRGPRGRR